MSEAMPANNATFNHLAEEKSIEMQSHSDRELESMNMTREIVAILSATTLIR